MANPISLIAQHLHVFNDKVKNLNGYLAMVKQKAGTLASHEFLMLNTLTDIIEGNTNPTTLDRTSSWRTSSNCPRLNLRQKKTKYLCMM